MSAVRHVKHPFSVKKVQRRLQRERIKDILSAHKQDTLNLEVPKKPQQKATAKRLKPRISTVRPADGEGGLIASSVLGSRSERLS